MTIIPRTSSRTFRPPGFAPSRLRSPLAEGGGRGSIERTLSVSLIGGDVVRVSAAIISRHGPFSLFASGAQEVQFQRAAFFFARARARARPRERLIEPRALSGAFRTPGGRGLMSTCSVFGGQSSRSPQARATICVPSLPACVAISLFLSLTLSTAAAARRSKANSLLRGIAVASLQPLIRAGQSVAAIVSAENYARLW